MRAITALLLAGLAQAASVGIVNFPVTAKKPETQACFNRAVAMLHSFWFEEAREQFEICAAAEPGFDMAWWGVAMTYNHSLWNRVWPVEARAALTHVSDPSRLSPKERAWLDAVKLLFGEGKKRDREIAYSKALAQIHHA